MIDLSSILERKSVFLFGPRQTGKTTWLKKTYPHALYINLLSKPTYDDYTLRGNALVSDIELFERKNKSPLIIIDEIQKMPSLLDEIHNQIEKNKKRRFILTGSSARKLKRMGANLLGGRASWKNFFPFVYPEIESDLKNIRDIERRLLIGGIPGIYFSNNPFLDFDDYIQLYLNEEIRAEGAVRNYEAFNRFLLTAALMNSKQVNFTQLGTDAQIPPRTAQDYFQILEDTLIGFLLPAYVDTPSRKAMTTAKFYLFDTGLTNALLRRVALSAGTAEFGEVLEQFIVLEIKAYCSYKNLKSELFYWRSTSKLEVDIIIKSQNQIIAIEVKAKDRVSKKELNGLQAFCEDHPKAKKLLITLDSRHYLNDGVEFIPVLQFLKELWSGNIF